LIPLKINEYLKNTAMVVTSFIAENTMKKLLLLILSFMLVACARGPVFEALSISEDDAVVYIYRPNNVWSNCCVGPKILINGEESGVLGNGAYLAYRLPAGNQQITAHNAAFGFYRINLDIELEAGKEYFIQWYKGVVLESDVLAHASRGDNNLVQMQADVGLSDISHLTLSQ
jgi:Protein of unknown function (DUF2846)